MKIFYVILICIFAALAFAENEQVEIYDDEFDAKDLDYDIDTDNDQQLDEELDKRADPRWFKNWRWGGRRRGRCSNVQFRHGGCTAIFWSQQVKGLQTLKKKCKKEHVDCKLPKDLVIDNSL